jgi:3-hydroxyacyl-CoA dehydrogenase
MVKRMGKTPVVIRDAPGLLVHRLLTAAREQVAILEEEGISGATIGRASRAYGWDPKPLGLPEGGGVARGEGSGGTLQDIQARITLAVVNEAASLLADGVASRSGDVDLAMVLSGGFPAFRGGLLRQADAEGPARLQAKLLEAQENWGKSFSPTPVIRTLAESGRTFYETFA